MADPGPIGDVGEPPGAVVPQEHIGADVGHVEIDVAVIVIISARHPHSVAAVTGPTAVGRVFEARSTGGADVAIEPVGRPLVGPADAPALHEVGVEVAVAVHVEEGGPAADDLGQVEAIGVTRPPPEVKPDGRADLLEGRPGGDRRGRGGQRRRLLTGRSAD